MPSSDLSVNLVNLIALHRAAVAADEARFDDSGKLTSGAVAAEITLPAEKKAFRSVVERRCETPADVQYKIDYLLTGDVGERDRLIDRLALGDEEGVNITALLRSLSHAPAIAPAEPFISSEVDELIDIIEKSGAGWYVAGGLNLQSSNTSLVFEFPPQCNGLPDEALKAMQDFQTWFQVAAVRNDIINHAFSIGAYYVEIGSV